MLQFIVIFFVAGILGVGWLTYDAIVNFWEYFWEMPWFIQVLGPCVFWGSCQASLME